jgi:hypothetical protein
MSPNTRAVTTAAAGDINQNYQTAGDAVQKSLAQRGFGRSGASGKATLQTELGRQAALAGNESAGAKSQLDQNNQSLLAALNYALTGMGSTTTSTGTQNESGQATGSQTTFGAQAGFGLPGVAGQLGKIGA